MITFLSHTEHIFAFLFLILSVTQAYPFKQNRPHKIISVTVFVGIYAVFTHFISFLTENYTNYILFLIILGGIYTILFINEVFPSALSLLITSLFLITHLKGLLSVIFNNLLPLNTDNPLLYPAFYLTLYTLYLLMVLFFAKYPLHTIIKLPTNYWIIMLVLPPAITLFTNLFIGYTVRQDFSNAYLALILLILIMAEISIYYLSCIIINVYDNLMESQNINQRLNLQLNHVERSESMILQIRRDKHEMKNVYFYIHSLIKSNKMAELEEFVDTKLLHRFDSIEEYRTGNKLIDLILEQKANETRDYHIQFMVNCSLPSKINIDDGDLCGLLLNLLDNAIDASKKEENGDIHVNIHVVKNYLTVQIKNKSSVDILKNNPHLFTTKKDQQNHGVGLHVVNSIVNKYNGIFRTSMESGYFVADIMLEMS